MDIQEFNTIFRKLKYIGVIDKDRKLPFDDKMCMINRFYANYNKQIIGWNSKTSEMLNRYSDDPVSEIVWTLLHEEGHLQQSKDQTYNKKENFLKRTYVITISIFIALIIGFPFFLFLNYIQPIPPAYWISCGFIFSYIILGIIHIYNMKKISKFSITCEDFADDYACKKTLENINILQSDPIKAMKIIGKTIEIYKKSKEHKSDFNFYPKGLNPGIIFYGRTHRDWSDRIKRIKARGEDHEA